MSEEEKLANLLGLARTAALGGNHEEALNYYNRVLEADPNLSDAWIGKGKAAGWQSTMANIRLNETLIAFNHAIATASAGSKESIIAEAVSEVNAIVVALYSLARGHLIEYASLDNTWPTYLGQVSQLLEALDRARDWDPQDRITLDNIVHLCKDNIEGYSFRDQFNNNVPVAYGITESYEALLRQRLDQAVQMIRASDESYAPPNIEKKKADACFVVTATMGDFNHPDVVLLRSFRDRWIMKRLWGPFFVRIYYWIGPLLAAIIERSSVLRAISYSTVVRPAVHFATRISMQQSGDLSQK